MRSLRHVVVIALAALEGPACNPARDAGYVEIKTVPVSSVAPPPLYLDSVKLAPLKSGIAVLRQTVGTAKLFRDTWGTPVRYERGAGERRPRIISAGPDRQFNTGDDIPSDELRAVGTSGD